MNSLLQMSAIVKEAAIRIGHRGLEHREFDDTYWLNGTNIDRDVYDQELQRIIAHENGRRTQQQIQMEAMQNSARQQELYAEAQARAASIGVRIENFYGYAAKYPGGFRASGNTFESDQSGARARADSAKAAQEANEALARKERKRAKTEPTYSLKNSPLFGRKAMGPFYNWTFDSPFKPLHRWLVRWAWQYLRHARAS